MPDWLALTAAQVEPEEAFFNVSFWRQLVGVFLGAALALVGAALLRWIFDLRRKGETARTARNTLIVEVLRNLRSVDTMDSLTQRTKANAADSTAVWLTSTSPSLAVFQHFLSPDVIAALTPLEHAWIVACVGNLENLHGRYDAWAGTLTSPQAMAVQARHPGSGAVKPHWQLVTDDLLWAIATVRTTLTCLLTFLSKNMSGAVIDPELHRIRTCLKPVSLSQKHRNFTSAGRSSDLKAAAADELREYVVVWKHDWPECPCKVIELSIPKQHDPPPAASAGR